MQTKLKIAPARSISIADAKAMREVAIDFWSFYYPSTQSLVTQLFGWDSPGAKYDTATITCWLESESKLVRDRIGYLLALHSGKKPPLLAKEVEISPKEIAPEEFGQLAILSGDSPWFGVVSDYFIGEKVVAIGNDLDGNLLVKLATDESPEPYFYRTSPKWLVPITPEESEIFDRVAEAKTREEILSLVESPEVKKLLKVVSYKLRNKFEKAKNPSQIPVAERIQKPAKSNNRGRKTKTSKVA